MPGTDSLIRVNASAVLTQDGRQPSGNAIENSISQCVADSVEGSFHEYPSHVRRLIDIKATRFTNEDTFVPLANATEATFSFGLPARLFPVTKGGLQLLVNFLAGDFFPNEVSGCQWSQARVNSISLPEEMTALAVATFRASAHTIEQLRAMFRLPAGRPLLAFSLKPRVGLSFADTRQITLDTLRAGFNIVELDSKNLALNTAPLRQWLDLAVEAAGVGSHITAFSPNLSIPAPQLVDVVHEWTAVLDGRGPAVVKVDGGLDGLTGLQVLRCAAGGKGAPVITSYPVLRNQLASAIGSTTWVDFLALSGADVVYPGGRPTFPLEPRPVWGDHPEAWSRVARRYDRFVARGWPMPTMAGGIHPGQLHALYELMGPDVAYFLGGAVALHPRGIRDGARLCVSVLEHAIELAQQAVEEGLDHSDDLPARLLRRVEGTKYPSTTLNYVSPADMFVDPHRPAPFYRRDQPDG